MLFESDNQSSVHKDVASCNIISVQKEIKKIYAPSTMGLEFYVNAKTTDHKK
jgi:hypothetical protein